MHDFDLVAFADNSARPIGATDDAVVYFDSDPFFWQREKVQKLIEVDLLCDFEGFAV